jgi:hypothetical protein
MILAILPNISYDGDVDGLYPAIEITGISPSFILKQSLSTLFHAKKITGY